MGKYAIIIEDKVNTNEHSGQLGRYPKNVAKYHAEECIIPIYFKTGDQSNYEKIKEQGYYPFRRKQFLETLKRGIDRGVTNDIFKDYYRYLESIEQEVQDFLTRTVDSWEWNSWKGFYMKLQEILRDGTWDYVAKKSGGFLGFWWRVSTWNNCDVYLQLEMEKLCFKICVEESSAQSKLRDEWQNIILAGANFKVKRPLRMGKGTSMTVALSEKDYRLTDANGVLDMDKTVELLRRAEQLLDNAISG